MAEPGLGPGVVSCVCYTAPRKDGWVRSHHRALPWACGVAGCTLREDERVQRRILGLKSRGFFKDQGGVGMTRAGYIKGELYYCFLYFYFFKDFIYFIFR